MGISQQFDMKSVARETFLADLNWAVGLNRFSLRLMGVWPDDEVAEARHLRTVLRVPLMMSIVFWCIVVPQIYALVLVRHDLLLVIDNFMTSFPAVTGCIKFYFLWRSKEVLRPVVASLADDWLRSKSSRELLAMQSAASIARLFTLGGYSLITGSLICFVAAPLCGLDIRVVQNITDYGKHHLLVQSYYPYDYSGSPQFEITHCTQVVAGFLIAMSLAVPDNYFAVLVSHLAGQFELLGMNVERFILGYNGRSRGRENFHKSIGLYVERHVHLISLAASVKQSFSLILLTQVLGMCVMACCLGVRILYTIVNPYDKTSTAQIINLLAALLSLITFTFGNCYASESLATHSSGVFHRIYNSDWYNIRERASLDLVLLMVMSQNPQTISAGKILYLSLSSFCSILKSIGSVISVLVAHSHLTYSH